MTVCKDNGHFIILWSVSEHIIDRITALIEVNYGFSQNGRMTEEFAEKF